jgi:hypothetical protein
MSDNRWIRHTCRTCRGMGYTGRGEEPCERCGGDRAFLECRECGMGEDECECGEDAAEQGREAGTEE